MEQKQLDLNVLAREKMYNATIFERNSFIEGMNQDFIKLSAELQETKDKLAKLEKVNKVPPSNGN